MVHEYTNGDIALFYGLHNIANYQELGEHGL